ncbi:MAG: hypothetical protein JNM68_11565 [Dinghuibacter sp.]|nr:hypothetical protein [Dinghuibacter sp.]
MVPETASRLKKWASSLKPVKKLGFQFYGRNICCIKELHLVIKRIHLWGGNYKKAKQGAFSHPAVLFFPGVVSAAGTHILKKMSVSAYPAYNNPAGPAVYAA